MPQKIGLIGDIHATPDPVAEALAIFRKQGVDRIFCVGDIAGYGEELDQSIALLKQSGCQSILGNHELWFMERQQENNASDAFGFFSRLPKFLSLTIEGRNLYLVHASPPQSAMKGIQLLDETGQVMGDQKKIWENYLINFAYDVLVVGHTHQVFIEKLGRTLVINPGSTKFNHTCAILSLPDMTCEIHALSGKAPLTVWNWGMFVSNE